MIRSADLPCGGQGRTNLHEADLERVATRTK